MGSLMGEDDDDQDQDSIKEAFLETNFYLLVMTFVVSILHTIFEFLAFKNGIPIIFSYKNSYLFIDALLYFVLLIQNHNNSKNGKKRIQFCML